MVFKLSHNFKIFDKFLIDIRNAQLYQLSDQDLFYLKSKDYENFIKNNENDSFLQSIITNNDYMGLPFFYLQLHLLEKCNLNCKHCYSWKKNSNILTLDQAKYIIDEYVFFLKRIKRHGKLALTGGEPTLYPNLIELIEYVKQHDTYIEIDLLSNGINLSKKLLSCITRNKINVQISLDGLEQQHNDIRGIGSFKKTINTIKRLLKHHVYVCVQYVLNSKNSDLSYLEEYIKFIDDLGVNSVEFSPLIPLAHGKELPLLTPQKMKQILEFLATYKSHCSINKNRPLWCLTGGGRTCGIGQTSLTIDSRGDILACRRLPLKLGNIFYNSLFDIWLTNEFLNQTRTKDYYNLKCKMCSFFERCKGCRALAASLSGDPFAPDPLCWYKLGKDYE